MVIKTAWPTDIDALLKVKLVPVRNVCMITIKIILLTKNPTIGINIINAAINEKPKDTLFLSILFLNKSILFGLTKPFEMIAKPKIALQNIQKLTNITP